MKKGDLVKVINSETMRGRIVETRVAHCITVGSKSFWYAEGDLEPEMSDAQRDAIEHGKTLEGVG
jgi:hypothetical protein